MKDHDPRPLIEAGSDAPETLRDALAAARADLPRADRLASLAGRLPLGTHPSPPNATPGAGTAAPAPSILSGVVVGAALGAVVSGAGLYWDVQRAAPAPAPSVVASPMSPQAPEPPRALSNPPRAPAPRAVVEGAPPAAAPSRGASTPALASGQAAPDEAPASEDAGVKPSALPDVAGGAKDERTEAELLESARNRLSASPGEALSLTQEHAARFPRGVLSQEREVLAIRALLALGRADEARARRDRFAAAYPGSAHNRLLATLFAPPR
jgi:hypothetical protein